MSQEENDEVEENGKTPGETFCTQLKKMELELGWEGWAKDTENVRQEE